MKCWREFGVKSRLHPHADWLSYSHHLIAGFCISTVKRISIRSIMCASKRVVSITIKYLWYCGNISVVTTCEYGSQRRLKEALFLKQYMFISFREEVYFIPPYLSSDRICWNLFWVRNRTHPQTPPKLSSLEWIKF